MSTIVVSESAAMRLLASSRRFFRWLANPHVVLALIMLAVLFYMVVIPLYRMVATTVTWQAKDLTQVQGAEVGTLTAYHYVRMLTGVLGRIYTYARCAIRLSWRLAPP